MLDIKYSACEDAPFRYIHLRLPRHVYLDRRTNPAYMVDPVTDDDKQFLTKLIKLQIEKDYTKYSG